MFILEVKKSYKKVNLTTHSCENHQREFESDFVYCPFCREKLRRMTIQVPWDSDKNTDIDQVYNDNCMYLLDLVNDDLISVNLDEYGENLKIEIYEDESEEAIRLVQPVIDSIKNFGLAENTTFKKTVQVEQQIDL